MSNQYHEYFTFDGVKSCDYGVWISGEATFNAPERDVEVVEIPGRNGTLTLDNGRWKNVEVVYPCYMSGDFLTGFDAFKNAILTQSRPKLEAGIRLVDTYHPGTYRYARIKGGIKPATGPYNRSAKFDIAFDCWPQVFDSTSTQTYYTSGSTIAPPTGYDPTKFPANPLIFVRRVSGTGTVTITINSTTITVANPAIYVDCETMRAFHFYGGNQELPVYDDDALTLNSGKFPTLNSASNTITFSTTSGTVQVGITPRWWKL